MLRAAYLSSRPVHLLNAAECNVLNSHLGNNLDAITQLPIVNSDHFGTAQQYLQTNPQVHVIRKHISQNRGFLNLNDYQLATLQH